MTQTEDTIRTVQSFWDANPCGSRLSVQTGRAEYFAEIEAMRYAHESHIPKIAKFKDFRGKRVLEIGTGIGTDGLQFQTNGADYVGVDLTLAGPQLAKEQFGLAGYDGKFSVADAEILPLADGTFEHIYSFGVIHHSPSTEALVDEMYRVLKPGGTFCVMVYNRMSINYYLEIMFLRRLFRLLLYPSFMPRIISALLRFDRDKLEKHRQMLLRRGRVSKEEWISMNTDGPECPLAKVYSKRDVLNLFRRFSNVQTEVWFFDRSHWSFIGRMMPDALATFLGRRWGWHRIVYGKKSLG
ncbi:MAG TPA: class I SAM-dependent methyltransferase [Pyrinomonadaceae bacterium]|nr:class I SAM-dependent methyltransferase [Pyrinomonadaceae bacterium]